jgi:TonB family protein
VPAPATPPESDRVAANEVLPKVSRSALDTVRGTLRVSLRVTVDGSGRVIDAAPDDPGPSRYFERHSLEAAKQWTFVPADQGGTRTMQIRFAFTRSGVTASAKPIP